MQNFIKPLLAAVFAVAAEAFTNVMPLIILAFAFVVVDCISAWRLSRRVHKSGCNNGIKGSCGKFKSYKLANTVFQMLLVIPTGLLLAFFTQKYLFNDADVRLPQIFAGIVIFWQLWSILENESSCNGSIWAKILQKIMIDKTSRHFDVDLSLLEKNNENEK